MEFLKENTTLAIKVVLCPWDKKRFSVTLNSMDFFMRLEWPATVLHLTRSSDTVDAKMMMTRPISKKSRFTLATALRFLGKHSQCCQGLHYNDVTITFHITHALPRSLRTSHVNCKLDTRNSG